MRVNTSLPLWVSVFLRPMVSTMTVISPTPTTMMRQGKHQQRPINHRDKLEPVWLRRCGNGLANPLDYTNSFLFTIFFFNRECDFTWHSTWNKLFFGANVLLD